MRTQPSSPRIELIWPGKYLSDGRNATAVHLEYLTAWIQQHQVRLIVTEVYRRDRTQAFSP